MSDNVRTIPEVLAGHEFEDGVREGDLVADAIVVLRIVNQETGRETMLMSVSTGMSTIVQQGLLHMASEVLRLERAEDDE